MEHCEVGMFRIPGLKFPKGFLPEDMVIEMAEWCRENHVGIIPEDADGSLWSFRNEKHRDWFILRWSDSIAKLNETKE